MRDHFILAGMMIAVFSGCSLLATPIDQDNFYETFTREGCKKLKQCSRGYFDSEYSDVNDCVDSIMNDADDYGLLDTLDSCDFDDGNAADCLDTFVSSDCEDWYQGDAYDDCDFADIYDNCE